MKTCLYCGNSYQKDTEHVFPEGLGGQKVYVDFVCGGCNNRFSGLERELYQKSLLGLLRSEYGLRGSTKLKNGRTPFDAPLLVMFDDEDKIIYEVSQYQKLRCSILPQILNISNNFYIQAELNEDLVAFNIKFKQWLIKSFKLVTKVNENGEVEYIEYFKIKGKYRSHRSKALKVKGAISLELMDKKLELFKYLHPRIFMDEKGKLRIRARSRKEAYAFLKNLLNFTLQNKPMSSFSNKNFKTPTISVGFSFNANSFVRAIVKITLNSLIHYFPSAKDNIELLRDFISFVNTGFPVPKAQMGYVKNPIYDSVEDTHHIFFHQGADFLSVRASFFNGSFTYSYLIPELKVLSLMEYNRLLIDFKNKKNKLETQSEFFESFNLPGRAE